MWTKNMYVILCDNLGIYTLSFLQMQDIERHLHVYIAADKWPTFINIQ